MKKMISLLKSRLFLYAITLFFIIQVYTEREAIFNDVAVIKIVPPFSLWAAIAASLLILLWILEILIMVGGVKETNSND